MGWDVASDLLQAAQTPPPHLNASSNSRRLE